MGGLLALAVILIGLWLLSLGGVHSYPSWALFPMAIVTAGVEVLFLRALAKRQ
jgi:hypothetical protein